MEKTENREYIGPPNSVLLKFTTTFSPNIIRRAVLVLAMHCAAVCAKAQQDYTPLADNRQFSIGFSAGISDFWGDVGTKYAWQHIGSQYYHQNMHYMGSILAKYSINSWLSARLGYSYGAVYASDQFNKYLAERNPTMANEIYQRYMRNLDMRTDIHEGSLVFELNPFRAFDISRKVARFRLQPVLLAGVGYFHFDPYGTYESPDGTKRWVRLHDLHTEGQGLPGSGNTDGMYSLNQFNLPLGLGLRCQLSDNVSVSLEYLYRYCFTDYLDDVSGVYANPAAFDRNLDPHDAAIARIMADKTVLINPEYAHPPTDLRGSPAQKDAYTSFGITFFYTFPNVDYSHSFFRSGRTRQRGERLF